jgi:tRNA (guanine37-N1)-methyltransferase
MKFTIITLFPELFDAFTRESIIGHAVEDKKIQINLINLRNFGLGKHKQVDDTTFGGGTGMLMMCEPIFRAFDSIKATNKYMLSPDKGRCRSKEHSHKKKIISDKESNNQSQSSATEGYTLRIFLTPQGKTLTQQTSKDLHKYSHLILLCGRYEGVDQRVRDELIDQEISIGNYVLSGGELPAMVLVDSVSRLIPGVLGKDASHEQDSFSKAFEGKKEYPQYTKPAIFEWEGETLDVPEVLQSGHHGKIEDWRKKNLH